jgi:hypothetical protein
MIVKNFFQRLALEEKQKAGKRASRMCGERAAQFPLLGHSGQSPTLARNGSGAYDPTATLAVHCRNGFDAGFSPYQSTRLSR